MDPVAGTDIKRKKRREFSGSDSGDGYLYRLKRFYTSKILEVEKILPIVSKKWLYDILIIIKKSYEHVVKSIDSMLKLEIKLYEIKVQNMGLDLELNEQFKRYRKKIFDLQKKILFRRNPTGHLVKNIRKEKDIVKSILNAPTQLEGVLPSITEPWLKHILLGIREKLLKPHVFKAPKVKTRKAPKTKIPNAPKAKIAKAPKTIYKPIINKPERLVKNPKYSVEVRFYDDTVDLYDLILKEKIDSKTFKKKIEKIQKWGYNSFRLLDNKNKFIGWIYVGLEEETYSVGTEAGYIFGIQTDRPDHGYYIGTYEIGEFYLSKDTKLIKTRSFPLEYCSRGCISPSNIFFLGLRENNNLDVRRRHYLAKVDWKSEPFIEWKKLVPTAIMAISLIKNNLYVGLKDGTLQIWDIEKEDCIENLKLFNSTITIIDISYKNIIAGSSTGEIAYLSYNREIIWRNKISQTGIKGIFENEDAIIIIDKKGNLFQIDSETGKIVVKRVLELKGVRDPSISSNLIFIRDWFVISGDAAIWVFWDKDYSLVYHYTSNEPLIRKLYPNPSGFYVGNDEGGIQFWKFGFKIKSVSEKVRKNLEKKPDFHNFELL